MKDHLYSIIASELSRFSGYFERVLYGVPFGSDKMGLDECLFEKIVNSNKSKLRPINETDWDFESQNLGSTLVVLNSVINHHYDIETVLDNISKKLKRDDRLAIVAYNPYFEWIFKLATRLGIRKGTLPSTYVTQVDLLSFAKLAGLELIIQRSVAYFPFKCLGLGLWVNRIFSVLPLINWLGISYIAVLRPVKPSTGPLPSLSIVIPARNEKGNIRQALVRMPNLGCPCEVIFVEGHSSDGTFVAIEEAIKEYNEFPSKFQNSSLKLSMFRQTGKGKNNAVQKGFENATGDLLTILDADLTMPPEMLGRFYRAWCMGAGDFINGSRLVYPMEGDAMRFLNWLGNIFFAKTLSKVLGVSLGDTLCGTKLFSRADYQRFQKWNSDFGKFDPFGDFELIFPAACLGLGIVDLPIRYLARTYGSTNISRFRHGLMLLKMTWIGFWKIRLAKG